MSERDIQVGSRLKKVRQHRMMTQKQLADKLKISQTAIALWENGNRSLSLDAIDAIAKALNVSAGYILFGEKDVNDIVPSDEPVNNNNQTSTLAAHFDGDEYTEDELEEIRQFAEFVKSKRKNSVSEVNAAHHSRGDFTDEDRQADEDMLD